MPTPTTTASNEDFDKITGLNSNATQIDSAVSQATINTAKASGLESDKTGTLTGLYGALGGEMDGTNKIFTTSKASYIPSSLRVYKNNIALISGTEYTETDSTLGTFTLTDIPVTKTPLTFTNTVGVNISGNNITKTAINGWGNAGTFSEEFIELDGSFSTTVDETNTSRMIGFSYTDTNQSFNTIDYAVFLENTVLLSVKENGVSKGSSIPYATGDVITISRIDGVVTYLNNNTVFYTSLIPSIGTLYVDNSLYTLGGTLSDIVVNTISVINATYNGNVTEGIVSLATQQEAFDNSTNKAMSPNVDYNLGRNQRYNIENETSGIGQVMAKGSTYNLFSFFTEANENLRGLTPVFKDVADATQTTYLDEANDKYLFASNLKTLNLPYVEYKFRVILTMEHASHSTNQETDLEVSLQRVVGTPETKITAIDVKIGNSSADLEHRVTVEFTTFVDGENDPFVKAGEGMFIQILNRSTSYDTPTLNIVDIDLFKR